MRAVVQRVSEASVKVNGEVISKISSGLAVLVGIGVNDTQADLDYIAQKLINLRIFEDNEGKMNLSVKDRLGEILLVSQFTLYGDCRGGRRPSFTNAAKGQEALTLFNSLAARIAEEEILVKTGQFGAHMDFSLVNDGPVTILLDSTKLF